MCKAVQAKNPKSFHPVELSVSSTFFLETSTVLQCCLYGSRAKWSPWQELWFNLRSDLRGTCWHLELSPFEPYLLTHLISKNAWEGKATPNITYVGSTLHPITSYWNPLNPIQYQSNTQFDIIAFPHAAICSSQPKKLFCQVLCQSWKPDIHFEAPETKKGENARKDRFFSSCPRSVFRCGYHVFFSKILFVMLWILTHLSWLEFQSRWCSQV